MFWADASQPGEVLVGSEAKQKAQEGESPIMFSKRSIGTTEPLRIGDRTYSAKEVATYILVYLKNCAEQALGQPVRRAVVTHPAYFDRNQIDETKQAAEAAGFDMSLPEQMMMEPAAAALAYLREEARDPMRVMTYDLGGGTFDVTILERREGVITLKSFDGDHLLGGYNFDREFMQWILNRVTASGRVIPYDDDNPDHRSRRARMLQLAENIKIQLSEQRTAKVPVQVKAQDILIDSEGRSVQFVDRITRDQYAALIKDHLDRTIECCRNALGKAELDPTQLDAILLVGGSTHGQWVTEELQQAFETEVIRHAPDLSVAAGAALRAGELPPVASGEGLELILDVLPVSPLPTINIAGQLRSDSAACSDDVLRDEITVLLQTPQRGILGPVPLSNNAHFLFADVELIEDDPTEFTVQVVDTKGLERLRKSFLIEYRPDDPGIIEISSSLPKPLYLRTAAGMRVIAEEGRPLPAKCEVIVRILHNDGQISIPVFQGDVEIGAVHVENIPLDVGDRSPVIVTVEITEKNEMRGDAKVLQHANGAVVAQCPVNVKFPPLPLPDLAELRLQFDELESRRAELLALSGDPEQRLSLGGQGARLARNIHKLFSEQAPDRQELHRAIKEFERLINPPPDDMEPPRSQFRRLIDDGRALLGSAASDPQMQPLGSALARIEADGNDAYTTKNHRKWATTNESLARLHDRIVNVTSSRASSDDKQQQELPPTPLLKDLFRQRVDSLRGALNLKRAELQRLPAYATRFKPRADRFEATIDKMEADVDKVDDNLESKRALGLLQVATRSEEQLKRSIPHLEDDVT